MKNQNGTQIEKFNNTMKKLAILLLATSLFACTKEEVTKIVNPENPATAQGAPEAQAAGTVNGGGGKGVVCTSNGKTVIETLDLYEARVLYGHTLNFTVDSEEAAVQKLAELVGRHYDSPTTIDNKKYIELLKTQIRKITLNKIKFISAGKKLKLTNDSFEPLIENNCKMVQLANYYDESTLLVDKDYWDKMDWTNKASLIAHELFYYIHRQRGASSSITSRKLVGQMFSTTGAKKLSHGMPSEKTKIASCYMSPAENGDSHYFDYYFYAFETKAKDNFTNDDKEVDGVEFVFTRFPDQPTLFRTSVFLSDMKLEAFLGNGTQTSGREIPLRVDSYDASNTAVIVSLNGEKKFELTIRDDETNTATKSFTVQCSMMTDGDHTEPIPSKPVPKPENPPATSQP